ncbi:MAG: haloacid dehalogenase-like hydrolase [Chitinophagaceae bacterium]|nr:MAG: haloacid dehalogenase-like hydrolase [Chitinophagaceae bacterium]
MKKDIAFFDFDGTITTKDTMLELIRFHHGSFRFYAGFLALSPWMVMMKAGFISNQATKEKMLTLFFGGMPEQQFNDLCRRFAAEKIPALIRPAALEYIRIRQAEGTETVLVSASAENWLRDWCNDNHFALLASILEVKQGRITGKLVGINCHGDEKVCRIRAAYNLESYNRISCFGDTGGDRPMLALGNDPHYKPFR